MEVREGETCDRGGRAEVRADEAGRKATIPKEKARAALSEGEAKRRAERRRGSKSIKCPAETFRLFIKFPRLLRPFTPIPKFSCRSKLCKFSLIYSGSPALL